MYYLALYRRFNALTSELDLSRAQNRWCVAWHIGNASSSILFNVAHDHLVLDRTGNEWLEVLPYGIVQ